MKGINMLRGAGALTVTFVITACGGESTGGDESCVWPGACGGDVAGTWNLRSACVFGKPSSTSCPSLSVSLEGQVSGTLTFAANGTYAANIDETARATATYPASCLTGVTECSALEATLGKPQSTTPSTTSATCTGTPATSCTCTITASFKDLLQDGTYTVSGNEMTMITADGKTLPKTYCVKGNQLSLSSANSDGTQGIVVGIRR